MGNAVSLLEHRINEEILEEEGWNGSGTLKEEMKPEHPNSCRNEDAWEAP